MNSGRRLSVLALLLCFAASAPAATRFVNLNNSTPTAPYTNWPAAATNIQDAIDVSGSGDLILVSNGVYNTGSRMATDSTPCRIIISKPVTVRSLNGPGATVIEGFSLTNRFPWSLNSVRCAYLTNGAVLSGFTVTNGSVRATAYVNLVDQGGGLLCGNTNAFVTNCLIINCAAYIGGGGSSGTYIDCLITNCIGHFGGGCVGFGNLERCEAVWGTSDNVGGDLFYCGATNCTVLQGLSCIGGGAFHCTLNQCTVQGNYAYTGALGGGFGGGVDDCILYNSIIYENGSDTGADNWVIGAYTNCCTTPLPDGPGNITNAPLFVDSVSYPGNLHLLTNSPAINAGSNALMVATKDLDGRPRIVGTRVDMGAYEVQGGDTNNFVTWLSTNGLPTKVALDFTDSDGDGLNNRQEWKSGTSPVDPSSYLHLVSLQVFPASAGIGWASVTNRKYSIERSTNLLASPPFTKIATNIVGQSGFTYFTNANSSSSCFYRVLVE